MNRCLLVVHFFNRQTQHRGQAQALITAAGEQTGGTDLFLVPGIVTAAGMPSVQETANHLRGPIRRGAISAGDGVKLSNQVPGF